MKRLNLFLGAAVVLAGFSSCKNETEKTAQKRVDHFVNFVDSINSLDGAERAANWAAIESEYRTKHSNAETAVNDLKDREKQQERINESKSKYEGVRIAADNDAKAAREAQTSNNVQTMRDTYFGAGRVGDNLDFSWVNKDNIVSVYQNFVDTFNKNKDSYSREDFDRIKTWYEALDARKNTVEKEGLTSQDNLKIASLKVEFAPKFKWERMTAKADENAEAKK